MSDGVQQPRYDAEARAQALIEMASYAEEWDWFVEEARPEFYADTSLPDHPEIREMAEQVFNWWLFFDAKTGDDERLVDDFLYEHGAELTAAQRAYLEAMRNSEMRLWEVVEVSPGHSLALHDVLEPSKKIRVRERQGSKDLHRWDLLACRVSPIGASGRPEIDGGALPFRATERQRLVKWLSDIRTRFHQDYPEATKLDFFEMLPPLFYRAWLKPPAPRLVNYDGDEILLTKSHFDVIDEQRLVAALDGAGGLDRTEEDALRWSWSGTGTARAEPVTYGWAELSRTEGRLTLVSNSRERAARFTALIESLAPGTSRHRLVETQHPEQLVKDAGCTEHAQKTRTAFADLPEDVRAQVSAAAERQMHEHYERWLDEPVPALDERTPREAARSDALQPRLVALLRQLESLYERHLLEHAPAFDPFWLWDELGLSDLRRGGRDHPPPLGHERMAALVDGLWETAKAVGERIRKASGNHPDLTVSREELLHDLGVQRLVREHAGRVAAEHGDLEAGSATADLVAAHVELMANFEVQLRKVFWVSEDLAWMLGATGLDVTGDLLKPPFASFALVFTDRYALGLAERALARDSECRLRGRMIEILTAYVTKIEGGLRIAFTCDIGDGEWPYLLVRDVPIEPSVPLDEIVAQHFDAKAESTLDPIFRCAPLAELLRLLFNAMLYATSSDARVEELPAAPPAPSKKRRPPASYSSESVFYLPATIEISALRAVKRIRSGFAGGDQTIRCMVRGHWRRAAKSYRDQRPRWIRPHWRGPSAAAIVERSYRLKP